MEIKPLLARMPAAERQRIRKLDRVAPSTDWRTGARTKRGHATNGRSRQTRQGRRILGPLVDNCA